MNLPFDRMVQHVREKPLSRDINQLQSDLDQALRFFARQLLNKATSVFLGDSLKVVPQAMPDMSVNVSAGLGFVDDAAANQTSIDAGTGALVGLNDLESFKPLPLADLEPFTVLTAPSAPNTRIDIIEVRADLLAMEAEARQFLNTTTGKFNPATVNKALSWALDGRTGTVNAPADSTEPLSYKRGVAANPGVAPSTTAGYIKLAEIAVGSDVTTIEEADILDTRASVALGGAKTIVIPAVAGAQTAAPTAFPTSVGKVVGTFHTASWIIPVSVPAGSRITGVRAVVEDVAGSELEAVLFRTPHNVGGASEGSLVQVGSAPSSNQSGNVQSLAVLTGGTEVVAAGFNYTVVLGTITGSGTVEIHAIEVDYIPS